LLHSRGYLRNLLLNDHVKICALLNDLLSHWHLLNDLTDFCVLLNDVKLADCQLLISKNNRLLDSWILMLQNLLGLLYFSHLDLWLYNLLVLTHDWLLR